MVRGIGEWYIENVHTKDVKFLNEGKFTIGRDVESDLSIDGRFKNHCSRKHCTIILKDDTVRIFNRVSFYLRFFYNDIDIIALQISNKIRKRR